MSRLILGFAVVLLSALSSTTAMAVTFGDLNCDASVNIIDVQISIVQALGFNLSPTIDSDQNGVPDACDAAALESCGMGTVYVDGSCKMDPTFLQNALDGAYADGYTAGVESETNPSSQTYVDGYLDALGLCSDVTDLNQKDYSCINYDDLSILAAIEDGEILDIQDACSADCVTAADPFPWSVQECYEDCISAEIGLSYSCNSCYSQTPSFSFEFGVSGIPEFGSTQPTDGSKMLLLAPELDSSILDSLGLGSFYSNYAAASHTQYPCILPGTTYVSFQWKLYSEEFLQWCSLGDDSFKVTFTPYDEQDNALYATTLLNVAINDLCPASECVGCGDATMDPNASLVPADVSFKEGGGYMTDWITTEVPLPPTSPYYSWGHLTFEVTEGDGLWNTAVLIDNIQLKGLSQP